MQLNLRPVDADEDQVQEVGTRLEHALATTPGVGRYIQTKEVLTIHTKVSRTQDQFTLQATPLDALSHWVPKLQNALQSLPQLSEVSSDCHERGLAAWVNVDGDHARRPGISMAEVDTAPHNAFAKGQNCTI